MRHSKETGWIIVFAMMTILVVGCADSDPALIDNEAQQRGLEVCVTTRIAPPLSRAANLTSDNIDHFGLMVNRAAAGNNWTAESHASRVKNGADWQPWEVSPPLAWVNQTNNVEVLAYAPLQTTSPITANAATRILTFNAATQPDREPADWVYYYSGKKSLSALLDAQGAVPVNFVHIMSRLRVEITMREELTGMQATGVQVLGTLPTVEWSSSAPTATNAKGTPTTVYATATGEAEGVWSTFIAPQSMARDAFVIRVAIDDKTYTYTHPNALNFITAKAYKFTLRLGRDKLELAPDGVTVTDWETGDEIPGGNATEKP